MVSVGYFRNGYVFAAAPNFDAIASALPSFSVRGYQHSKHPLWLVDLWEKPKLGEHFPFATAAKVKAINVQSDDDTVARALRAVEKALKDELDTYGVDEIRVARAVSKLAGQKGLFFKADDDLFDFACLTDSSGSVVRAQYRVDPLRIDVKNGSVVIEPITSGDDEEPVEEFAEAVGDIEGVEVRDAIEIQDGLPLYGSVLAVWPSEWPRPEESLGLGTWDPLEHLDTDCVVVFERLV